MAISKIMCIKESKVRGGSDHLKKAIEYIQNPEKTQNGRFVGASNCQVDYAYEQMMYTKRTFKKDDKRQGYHIVISFKEDEIEPDKAFEITKKFVGEYLGNKYESLYVVHDNTSHVHSHIIFNSVSFKDGRKYRYKKGDWEKDIQPIVNRLCKENGLDVLNIEDKDELVTYELELDSNESIRKANWKDNREDKTIWNEMIKKDLDECIIQANDYDNFLELLIDKGYEIKSGKYLTVKPPGMKRVRRCRSLGDEYDEEAIRRRISIEDLEFYKNLKETEKTEPIIKKSNIISYKQAAIAGMQKKHFAKIYQVAVFKKRAYSKVYKYAKDIRQMHKLQLEYNFLINNKITNNDELNIVIERLVTEHEIARKEMSDVYKYRTKCKKLFDTFDRMKRIESAKNAYLDGDEFFKEEYDEWLALDYTLNDKGYTYTDIGNLKEEYHNKCSCIVRREKELAKEIHIGRDILKKYAYNDNSEYRIDEETHEIIKEQVNIR